MCRLSRWTWSWMVRTFKNFRRLSALFRNVQKISPTYKFTGAQSATSARHLRAMPLARKILWGATEGDQSLCLRREKLDAPTANADKRWRWQPCYGFSHRHPLAHEHRE